MTVLKQMAKWAAKPVPGTATLLECGASSAAARPHSSGQVQGAEGAPLDAAPRAPILLRLLQSDVAVSRAAREASLQVLHAAMLAATGEHVPVRPRALKPYTHLNSDLIPLELAATHDLVHLRFMK